MQCQSNLQCSGHSAKFCGLLRIYELYVSKNCSDLLREKTFLVIKKNLLKFETEGGEIAKILRSQEQFTQTVKGQNSF